MWGIMKVMLVLKSSRRPSITSVHIAFVAIASTTIMRVGDGPWDSYMYEDTWSTQIQNVCEKSIAVLGWHAVFQERVYPRVLQATLTL